MAYNDQSSNYSRPSPLSSAPMMGVPGNLEPGKVIVGLDIGTTKVCAIVAAVSLNEPHTMTILGVGTVPAEGLSRGVVTNIEKTVRSIERAVSEAEAQSGVKIREVVVGIAGDHIQAFQSRGVVTISNADRQIGQEDINRLIEDTRRVHLPSDRKILHVIPQEYIVDGQDGIFEPIGMSGVRLEASVHIINGLVTAVQNIYNCVERAGLKVRDIVLEPLASSYAVLDDEEKEVGVALVDIGGGTTDIAVFEERTIRHTAVIGIAGQKVTDDIRKGLQILGEQAERLKREYGCSVVSHILRDEIIQLPGLSGRKPRQIERSLLARIIQPRMEEILEFSFKEIKRSGFARNLGAGVVLTGGGSMINSTRELAEAIFDMPVKIGMPMGFGAGLVKEIESPVYATAVGLVLFAFKNTSSNTLHSYIDEPEEEMMSDEEQKLAEESERKKPNVVGRMKEWFEHL
ncbi:MAG: cell division protein FtsA [bacterium]